MEKEEWLLFCLCSACRASLQRNVDSSILSQHDHSVFTLVSIFLLIFVILPFHFVPLMFACCLQRNAGSSSLSQADDSAGAGAVIQSSSRLVSSRLFCCNFLPVAPSLFIFACLISFFRVFVFRVHPSCLRLMIRQQQEEEEAVVQLVRMYSRLLVQRSKQWPDRKLTWQERNWKACKMDREVNE